MTPLPFPLGAQAPGGVALPAAPVHASAASGIVASPDPVAADGFGAFDVALLDVLEQASVDTEGVPPNLEEVAAARAAMGSPRMPVLAPVAPRQQGGVREALPSSVDDEIPDEAVGNRDEGLGLVPASDVDDRVSEATGSASIATAPVADHRPMPVAEHTLLSVAEHSVVSDAGREVDGQAPENRDRVMGPHAGGATPHAADAGTRAWVAPVSEQRPDGAGTTVDRTGPDGGNEAQPAHRTGPRSLAPAPGTGGDRALTADPQATASGQAERPETHAVGASAEARPSGSEQDAPADLHVPRTPAHARGERLERRLPVPPEGEDGIRPDGDLRVERPARPDTGIRVDTSTARRLLVSVLAGSQPRSSSLDGSQPVGGGGVELHAGASASLPLQDLSTGSDAQSGDRRHHDGLPSVPEVAWLRRASALEARLAPPQAFVVPGPAVPVPAPYQGAAGAVPAGFVQAHAALQPFEMPMAGENLSRLIQSLQIQARGGGSEATVRLNPQHLGEVTIAVKVDGGHVTAVVRAEVGDVRQWLKGQEEALRSALLEQGLTLDELVVEQDGRHRERGDERDDPRSKRPGARGRGALQPRFEVVV